MHQLHNCVFISSSGRTEVAGHPSARPDWKAFGTIRVGNTRAEASLVALSRRWHSGVCHLFNAISKTLQRDINSGVCAWAACRSSGSSLKRHHHRLLHMCICEVTDTDDKAGRESFPLLFNSWQDKRTAPAGTIIFYSDEESSDHHIFNDMNVLINE